MKNIGNENKWSWLQPLTLRCIHTSSAVFSCEIDIGDGARVETILLHHQATILWISIG